MFINGFGTVVAGVIMGLIMGGMAECGVAGILIGAMNTNTAFGVGLALLIGGGIFWLCIRPGIRVIVKGLSALAEL
jgi:hypothetical protein